MAVVLVQFDVVRQLADLAIDAHPGEALSSEAADHLGVGALLAPNHGSQQLIAGALRQQQDLIDHLVDALRTDRAITLRAMGLTSAAEQQAQVVLDFRDRSDGGAGVVAGGFLIDRNRRRQPLNGVHIWLVHLAQELSGVSGQTLDVAALTFRKNRVKSERAFAAATNAGEHHQLVAGNGDVDVLEVVLASATHPDHILQAAAGQIHRSRSIRALGSSSHHRAPIEST